jgi:AGZA family xanthine/uracil permease-like MFS transporter
MLTMKKLFQLEKNQTTFRTEIGGGVVTFMTMAYIIFVQPGVLSITGMDFDAVMMATCLSAALATFLMGFLANYPIALAPGMGENFLFVSVSALVIGGSPLGWRGALAAVFFSGLAFLVLSIFKVREKLVNAIPDSMKYSIAIGIGLFISFIGLEWAGIVVKNPAPDAMLMLGDLEQRPVLLAVFGIIVLSVLLSRGIKGAILWGILVTATAGLLLGIIRYQGIFALPPSLGKTAFQLDFSKFFTLDFLVIALLFLFMDLFDTIGTLIATASHAGFIRNGKLPRAEKAFLADASGTLAGSLLGTSTVTSFIESTTGVSHGARTGLASVITGILFLLATFFSPLIRMIGAGVPMEGGIILHPVTAPVLVLVGCLMFRGVRRIPWDQLDEAIPAFLVIIGMPLLYSIADGMAIGFIIYPLLKLIRGRGREVSGISWILAVMFSVFLISRVILL